MCIRDRYSSNVHLLQELLKPTQGHTLIPREPDSEYVGQSFSEILALHHAKVGTIPIAIEQADGEILLNPKDYVLEDGDKFICIASYQS